MSCSVVLLLKIAGASWLILLEAGSRLAVKRPDSAC